MHIFNLFADQDENLILLPLKKCDALDECTLYTTKIYERCHFNVLHVYYEPEKRGEDWLNGSSINSYFATLVNLAADRFTAVGTDATILFFNCLDVVSCDHN